MGVKFPPDIESPHNPELPILPIYKNYQQQHRLKPNYQKQFTSCQCRTKCECQTTTPNPKKKHQDKTKSIKQFNYKGKPRGQTGIYDLELQNEELVDDPENPKDDNHNEYLIDFSEDDDDEDDNDNDQNQNLDIKTARPTHAQH